MRAVALCLAAALGLALPASASPLKLDAGEMRRLAAAALASGDADLAATLARALLTRDADDPTALMLGAEAAVRAEDWPRAARLAARAHRRVEGPARFRAARLAGFALAQQGAFTRAQIWLRRASTDAPDAAERRGLVRDHRALADRNPLALRLGFGLAPSSNINGGSRAERLALPGLPFDFALSGDARALSGLATSGSAGLRYALRHEALPGPAWVDMQADVRLYRLSATARRQAPEARGADYARGALSFGITQRLDGPMPTDLSVETARHWYGGAPLVDRLRLGLARPLVRDEAGRLDLTLSAEYSHRHDLDAGWWVPGARLAYATARDNGDRLGFGLGLRRQPGLRPDLSHDALSLDADYDLARRWGPARVGFGITAEWRDYPATRYAFGGRADHEIRLETRIGLPAQGRYGFYPEIAIEARRAWSDVDLFDEEALTLDLGLRSSF